MMSIAVAILAVAAFGGAVMAAGIFKGKLAPWSLSLLHAGLGAAGLILVLLPVIGGQAGPRATQALVVLVVAAVGGFYLASLHGRKTLAPKAVVIIHALAAAAGLVLLVSTLV